ncbi:WS/DGAT domain-containing protein [Rhodococcus sp. IEGM 1401]|uniref:WS/DGAT domain-containing protein n=1 Tax=unclassified Rhodococcus (in: high G+C Gram-positive bacteria) TaxID=192944 RepID=UPI0022B36005|nr:MULTISPECIES: WS/DGAT domain-containing protein [unclassified Rhodococcus (in: high G+C Gram-positive bacteria)]MCZ4561940.1 WS/DGAT domain-containing protein [Rhodococcus sp. IEGM 1401]MDI9922714.1 WS/DGAT domain-containing protein [Rhodococcus sp. IEGM 1372]MDV8034541.1 WS/DGAT domain-containing protein [Rhodococcus sp. IEGM 1414]
MPRVRAAHNRPGSTRLHPTDARAYWMASKIPSDQFLLYCFASESGDLDSEVARLYERSSRIEVLSRRISDVACGLDYPRWTEAGPRSDAISVHRKTSTWSECLEAIAASFARQVDPRVSVWHLHLYPNIVDAPGGTALVAVLQLSHAAADGTLAARTARELFGTHPLPPACVRAEPRALFESASTIVAAATLPLRLAQMVRGGVRARRDALSLGRGTDSGDLPPPAHPRAPTALDVPPTGRTSVRTIVLPKTDLQSSGTTVTTFVLTAVSVALQRLLGDGPDLAAEVTVARDERADARNNFGNVGVGLFPAEPDIRTRSQLIAADLAARRARANHPLAHAARTSQDDVEAHVPAFLAEWGVAQFDPTAAPPTVTGNTVVSSVSRGAADLTLGGGAVRFTAGFPALSPAMSLTHGVHGIGDTVTIGITSNSAAVPDPDLYETLLRDALDEVRTALS